MNMSQAVSSVLSQYATFSGRARRSEYWWFFLALVLASIVAGIIDAVVFGSSSGFGVVSIILTLATIVPSLSVGARRLHDTGRSGWWQLIGIVPLVGWIVLIVFFVQDSQPPNRFGEGPKHGASPSTAY